MLIKPYSLFPIVNAKGAKIDQGAILRYLAEIIWFPSAALGDYIIWKELSPTELNATMTNNNLGIDGIFTFSDEGRPLSFRAKRYYGTKGSLETWQIAIDQGSFASFHEILIPTRAAVTWKLKECDFR